MEGYSYLNFTQFNSYIFLHSKDGEGTTNAGGFGKISTIGFMTRMPTNVFWDHGDSTHIGLQ